MLNKGTQVRVTKTKLRQMIRKTLIENYDYDIKYDEQMERAREIYSFMKSEGKSNSDIWDYLLSHGFYREVVDALFGH